MLARLRNHYPQARAVRLTPRENTFEIALILATGARPHLGYAEVNRSGDSLEFEMYLLDEKARDAGINRAFLSLLLREYPNTKMLPVSLGGTNLSALALSVVWGITGPELKRRIEALSEEEEQEVIDLLAQQISAAESPDQTRRMHETLAAAFWENTPAGRTRWLYGFRRLTAFEIEILPDELGIRVFVAKDSAESP